MKLIQFFLVWLAACTARDLQADRVVHFDMQVQDGCITDAVTGMSFPIEGNFRPENVAGVVGEALLFDGYTSHVEAGLGPILPAGTKSMTLSMWVALPAYPIIQVDTETAEKTPLASCLDREKKSGFGFYLGLDGKYSFEAYVGGWPVSVEASEPLPTYQWNNLVAVVDCDNRSVRIYRNGTEVGSGKVNGEIGFEGGTFYMGQGVETHLYGPFETMSYLGIIDEVSIWNEAKQADEIQAWQTDAVPDLGIPSSRFEGDLLRPRFHGMPAAGWTNECHGMCYSGGRYHLFFQKNANGPFMARLHWGHLSSENLYDWKEEKMALAPGTPYDIKGCWSGCVFADDEITDGKPQILYTAVDYSKATIARAEPLDENLECWQKNSGNPIVNGRPAGLSDDFRDPYFFRKGDNAYLIVGTSKDGIGATTLHRYHAASGLWSNDGSLFFAGSQKATDGSFWEMPLITEMPGGKWLFAATPQGTDQGGRTLYWVGTIGDDGTFVPDEHSVRPRLVELDSHDGYGLLSPTVCRQGDKTIALGIVPDKLPAVSNWQLGWAHCYSLPREWTLTEEGILLQKPYEGLAGLRTATVFERNDFALNGTVDLTPVSGRELEICGIFEVGSSQLGFHFFKSGDAAQATVVYDPSTGVLTADFSKLPRLSNDEGVYDGVYAYTLPERPAPGSRLKINLFIDHSIIDLFVNDSWATSIRVFPTDSHADGVEAFAASATKVIDLKAWTLEADGVHSDIGHVWADGKEEMEERIDVFNLSGCKVRSQVFRDKATDNLPPGMYVAGGKKVICR